MLVVMQLHRLGVDVGFERIVVVAERREFEDTLRGGRIGGERRCRESDGTGGEGEIFEGSATGNHGREVGRRRAQIAPATAMPKRHEPGSGTTGAESARSWNAFNKVRVSDPLKVITCVAASAVKTPSAYCPRLPASGPVRSSDTLLPAVAVVVGRAGGGGARGSNEKKLDWFAHH